MKCILASRDFIEEERQVDQIAHPWKCNTKGRRGDSDHPCTLRSYAFEQHLDDRWDYSNTYAFIRAFPKPVKDIFT